MLCRAWDLFHLSRGWDLSRASSRAAQLALLSAWVALVVWKVLTFLAEPTGSQIHFVDSRQPPFVTVCPYHGLREAARHAIYHRSHSEQAEYFGNGTLDEVFRREGLSLLHMMPYLRKSTGYKDDPHRKNYTDKDGNWTTTLNYAKGGLCGTFEVTGEFPSMAVARRRDFRESKDGMCDKYESLKIERRKTSTHISYSIFVHRLKDFWGAQDVEQTLLSDAEMASFNILDSTSLMEIVIISEREIMPNLRRKPCVEDFQYSRSTCWRDCFFDSLNCSVIEGNSSGKPLCEAMDVLWYHRAYYKFTHVTDEAGEFVKFKYPCLCPRPCVLDRYNIFVRPSYIESDRDNIFFQLSLKPVMRTVEMNITYGLTDLMVDVGGLMGLFLGFSILSMFHDSKSFASRAFVRHHNATQPLRSSQPHDSGVIKPELTTYHLKALQRRDALHNHAMEVYSVPSSVRCAWSGSGGRDGPTGQSERVDCHH